MVEVPPRGATRPELRTRIVHAAAALLHEHGPAAVTTRGVAEAAGVQAPTLYRLFGDKDGLLDAVAEYELARYVTGKTLTEDGDDPVADLQAAWNVHIEFGLANPALFILLADPARAARSPAAAAELNVLRDRVHRVASVGRLQIPEWRAVELIHAAGTGVVLTLLACPPENRDRRLPDTLYNAVMRTVLTEAPTLTVDGATSAAITLGAVLPQLTVLTPGERTVLAEWLDRIATTRS
jgi:AcrR family transcriptional regulator